MIKLSQIILNVPKRERFVDFDEEKLRYATIMHNAARGHNNEMMGRLKDYLDNISVIPATMYY